MSIETLTPEIADQLGLAADSYGVVVDGVEPGSLSAEAGLQRGDVIQEVNHRKVTSMAEFSQVVKESRTQTFLLLVNRNGSTHYVVLETQ
ncbi:MAG: PDZ domain-containing protein [Acidobacteriota bacterium]